MDTNITAPLHARARVRQSGQALVEMVAGLVVLLLLFAGLIQIGRLAVAHNRTLMEARAHADRRAMPATGTSLQGPTPLFIRNWETGADGVRYSQQDRPMTGGHEDLMTRVIPHTRPAEVARYAGRGPLQDIESSQHFSDALRLVRGQSRSPHVPVVPVLRRWVVRNETIQMEHTVWMPQFGRLEETP